LYEVLEITDEIRELILVGASAWNCEESHRAGHDHSAAQRLDQSGWRA
jgi:hypothetical protein